MFTLAYNPTDSQVVIDAQGRILGGREWGAVDTTADETKAALESGSLHIFRDVSPDEGNASAVNKALDQVAEVNRRAQVAEGLDKKALTKLVAPHHGQAKSMTKDELVAFTAFGSFDLEGAEPAPASSSGSKSQKSTSSQEG